MKPRDAIYHERLDVAQTAVDRLVRSVKELPAKTKREKRRLELIEEAASAIGALRLA